MIRALAVSIAVALPLVAVPSAGAHYKPKGKRCGTIVFTPNSDHASSSIRAKRTTCRKARRIVRKWERGNRSPLRFECRSREDDDALSHRDVKCTRGKKRVTFAAY